MSSEEEFEEPGYEPEEMEEEEKTQRLVTCKYCGERLELKDYMGHLKENHPQEYEELRRSMSEARKKAWERTKREFKEAKELKEKLEEMPPEQMVALLGREGLERLKFKRLMEMLDSAPGITASQKRWIEVRWNTYEKMRNDPQELFRVLKDEAGIKDKVAGAIVQAVFSLEGEYADILGRREPVFISRGAEGAGEVFPSWERPTTQPPYRPYWPERGYERYPPPPPPPMYQQYWPSEPMYPVRSKPELTEEKIVEIIDKYLEKRLERREIDEKLNFLHRAIEGLKDYVEEMKHEFEKQLLMKETEAKPSPELDVFRVKLEDAYRVIEGLKEEIRQLGKSLEEKEKEKLEMELKNLRAEQRQLRELISSLERGRVTEGYQSDTYRLLSQLVTDLSGRKPIETMLKLLLGPEKHIMPPSKPSPIPPEIEEELKSQGLLIEG